MVCTWQVRCSEFKCHVQVYNDHPFDVVNKGSFFGTMSNGMRMFNLDPKEERSYTIRKLIYRTEFERAMAGRLATFAAYPARVPITGK